MKKTLIVLAAIACFATACNKDKTPEEAPKVDNHFTFGGQKVDNLECMYYFETSSKDYNFVFANTNVTKLLEKMVAYDGVFGYYLYNEDNTINLFSIDINSSMLGETRDFDEKLGLCYAAWRINEVYNCVDATSDDDAGKIKVVFDPATKKLEASAELTTSIDGERCTAKLVYSGTAVEAPDYIWD